MKLKECLKEAKKCDGQLIVILTEARSRSLIAEAIAKYGLQKIAKMMKKTGDAPGVFGHKLVMQVDDLLVYIKDAQEEEQEEQEEEEQEEEEQEEEQEEEADEM